MAVSFSYRSRWNNKESSNLFLGSKLIFLETNVMLLTNTRQNIAIKELKLTNTKLANMALDSKVPLSEN